MSRQETCALCRFWLYMGEGETDLGECRRHAPRPMPEDELPPAFPGGSAVGVIWMHTRASDWCGEFSEMRLKSEGPA